MPRPSQWPYPHITLSSDPHPKTSSQSASLGTTPMPWHSSHSRVTQKPRLTSRSKLSAVHLFLWHAQWPFVVQEHGMVFTATNWPSSRHFMRFTAPGRVSSVLKCCGQVATPSAQQCYPLRRACLAPPTKLPRTSRRHFEWPGPLSEGILQRALVQTPPEIRQTRWASTRNQAQAPQFGFSFQDLRGFLWTNMNRMFLMGFIFIAASSFATGAWVGIVSFRLTDGKKKESFPVGFKNISQTLWAETAKS